MRVAQMMVDGFEDVEALAVLDLLRRASIEIDLISVFNKDFVTSSHQLTIEVDKHFNEIKLSDYDMLILPGGGGVDNYYQSKELLAMIKEAHQTGIWVAAICAAPQVLAKLGLLKGKKAISFPSVQPDLIEHGAILIEDRVVIDDQIITSKAMGTAIDFGLAIIEILKSKAEAEQVKDSIFYQVED